MTNKVETSKTIIYKWNEHTICLSYKPDINITLIDAIETSSQIHEITKDNYYNILIDLRGIFGNMTNEARNHFATDSKIQKYKIAEALLIDNLPVRIIAKFYMKFNKPSGLVKIFNNKEKAINWLEQIYNTKSE